MTTWTNPDGLIETYGTERAELTKDGVQEGTRKRMLVVDIDSQDLPALADINEKTSHLPANALITDAYLVATTAFTGTGTLSVGLGNAAGSAIDADGIDAAVDVDVALAAVGDTVACDGALVDKTSTAGAARAWVYAVASGSITAGVAKLYLEYITVV